MKEELTEAYETERPRLLGWMQRRIGLEEAEDVLHDVMVRSLVNLDSLGGVRDLTAWLWRGVRNGVVDVWRRRARRRNAGEADLADGAEFDEFIDSLMEGVEDRGRDRRAARGAARGDRLAGARRRDLSVDVGPDRDCRRNPRGEKALRA
jgi:DNA-directed RNA polymerase specialized sigma24 family protein